MDKQEDQLCGESTDIDYEIFDEIKKLIEVGWDSENTKLKIESLMKSRDIIEEALHKIWDKKK